MNVRSYIACPVSKITSLEMGLYSAVGFATRYGLDGPGFESRRSQWPSGLRRGFATAGILGLRGFELRRGNGCLCCVCCTVRTQKYG